MNVTTYDQFLRAKMALAQESGFPAKDIHLQLFDFQADIARWAVQRGCAAVFAAPGLGKTLIQCEFARQVHGPVLIFAPLAVTHQTVREGQEKLGMAIQYVRRQEDMIERVCIANYELWPHFVGVGVDAIILDESGILKSLDGKTRRALETHFIAAPMRLCCTATPAPNDIAEIANHAAFLGHMRRADVLATFFVHDQTEWRLRGHAQSAFFRWLSSWSISLNTPGDLGYDDTAFQLPPLSVKEHVLPWNTRTPILQHDGQYCLAQTYKLRGLTDRISLRQQTAVRRAEYAADLALQADGQVVLWTGLNSESTLLAHLLKAHGAVEVKGNDTLDTKEERLLAFASGEIPMLITKASIAGHGLNFQKANTAIFVGINDSHESYYQAVRRLWRFGQHAHVTTHVVIAEQEVAVWENVKRKEQEARWMMHHLIEATREQGMQELLRTPSPSIVPPPVVPHRFSAQATVLHGDAVHALKGVESTSVGLTITSPPFLSLYTYSPTAQDVGNCRTEEEFFGHLRYVVDELWRITMPGRNFCMHLSDVPAMMVRDGWIGRKNFRGHMVDHMEAWGWIYHGECTIDKNPQAQAIRTKAKGLLFIQKQRDASWLRPAMADYLLLFRKPGENAVPITLSDVTNDEWVQWAHPIWYDIRETETLNAAEGREDADDRHICPLQLGFIDRCVRLWSNPGELVCDPFAGIGSTGYIALKRGRRFVGSELKESYVRAALRNLAMIQENAAQQTLFPSVEAEGNALETQPEKACADDA